ncbi:MAG: helix-turn-helix domain-containing protein, partial [Burkholderiaceae bacterium]
MRPWRESLGLIERHVSFKRRAVHAGDTVQTAGDAFGYLHLVHFGAIKTMVVTACGCQQVTGLHLMGDWVGFDGIATGYSACDGYAMDTSEVWTVCYAVLLQTAERVPELAHVLHIALGSQLAHHHKWRIAKVTLPVDARLANFLCSWVQALALRDLRTDNIRLLLTRAEIGNYLGMTLETVSRSFSRLAEIGLIAFDDKGRRHFAIPDIDAM